MTLDHARCYLSAQPCDKLLHFARVLARPGRDLLEAPLRRPWLVLGPTALAFLAATAAALLLPPRYRAVALVRVDWAAEDASVAQRLGGDPDSRRLSFLRLRVLSRPAVERVLEEAKTLPRSGPRRAVRPWSQPRGFGLPSR